jgi:hypothetical protein
MELLYQHCAGLDVHKKNVKVCLVTPGADGQPHKERLCCENSKNEVLLCQPFFATRFFGEEDVFFSREG